jgi:type IV pilus assembly protein PilW
MNTHTRTQSGFSIVELMVAITIGLFLLAGAVTIFSNSKRTYTETDDSSRMQESLRFAMDMIAQDIRMAGYFGCAYAVNPTNLKNNVAATATLFDTARGPFQGYDESAATKQWWPVGPSSESTIADSTTATAAGITPVVGSDAITIRHAGGPRWRVTAAMADASAALTVNNVATDDCVTTAGATAACSSTTLVYGGKGTTIPQNRIVAASTCGTGDIFKATAASSTSLTHAGLGAAYGTDAMVSAVTFVRYFVGMNNGEPALYREEPNAAGTGPTQTLLLPGIENLQITYGVDTDATKDGVANNYLAAGANGLQTAADWANVVSVRIGMIARSQASNAAEVDSVARTLNGTNMKMDANGVLVDAAGAAVAGSDNRRRRTMETTVMLRNRFIASNFGG